MLKDVYTQLEDAVEKVEILAENSDVELNGADEAPFGESEALVEDEGETPKTAGAKITAMTTKDRNEFSGYLRQCTDQQVQGVYDKETAAGRRDYAQLAAREANRRGITLEESDAEEDEDTSDETDFIGYLRNCSDAQVQGVYEKETAAGRENYAQLAENEAARRGISLG
jgi:hypothetical protein